ncbi:MAG: helix-turn-helix transcriptional regulator [Prevotella sp.]|nr:helix-turn-helix transcriptional regulator [Prevotella sp.]
MVLCAVITVELALELLRDSDRPRRCLLIWAATATVLYTCHYIFFHHVHWLLPWSNTVYVACNLAVYPLYLVYISELADTQPLSSKPWAVALLLCPAVAGGLASGIAYIMMSPGETANFISTYLYEEGHGNLYGVAKTQAVIHDVTRVLFSLEVVGVLVFCVKKVRNYNKKLDLLYADTERRSLNWVNIILALLIITSLFSLVANRVGRQWFEGSLWLALPSLAFTSVLFTIGWIGLHKRLAAKEILQRIDIREIEDPIQAISTINPIEAIDTIEAIDAIDTIDAMKPGASDRPKEEEEKLPLFVKAAKLIEGEKLFLHYDLRLDEVADMLGTNRTYLIYALNEGKGISFKEYINRLRIAYAKQLMAENPALSKSQVASMCGYNTPSSFYRNWKRYEGEEGLKGL